MSRGAAVVCIPAIGLVPRGVFSIVSTNKSALTVVLLVIKTLLTVKTGARLCTHTNFGAYGDVFDICAYADSGSGDFMAYAARIECRTLCKAMSVVFG